MPQDARQWMEALLGRHQIARPDGRPLYTYRCNLEEYQALSDLVGPLIRTTLQKNRLRRLPGGLFCLFTAEWVRRRYAGGPLRWADILAAMNATDVPYPSIQDLVHQGLDYWHRPLLRVGNARIFLLTLACEGGLPLQVLQRENATLRRYFRALLKDIQTYRATGYTSETLAAQLAHHLPKSLRQDMVYSLAGQLCDEVWNLQQRVGDETDPIAALDRSLPDWRARLPLELSDKTAQCFLDGLMTTATDIARSGQDGLRLTRGLQRDGSGWRLDLDIALPGRLTEPETRALLGETPKGRFELALQPRDSEPAVLGWGSPSQNGFLFERARRLPSWTDDTLSSELQLSVRPSACASGPQPILGGEPLEALPWVFVDTDGDEQRLQLRGQGSIKTRYPKAWVAIGRDDRFQGDPGAEVVEMGELPALRRKLYRLEGSASVITPDGSTCRIATRSEASEETTYRLVGKTPDLVVSPIRLFLGTPRLLALDEDGTPRLIQAHQLQSRALSGGDWRSLGADSIGTGELRFIDKGALRFRTRLCILPTGFRVSYEPGLTASGGRLRLSGVPGAALALVPTPGITGRTLPATGTDALIEIQATGTPPSSAPLALRWPSGAECRFQVPFPAGGAHFLAPDDAVLPPGALVPRDRLSGVRARLLSPTGAGRFTVSDSLRAPDLSSDLTHKVWVEAPLREVPGSGGRIKELDLLGLRDDLLTMLSASTSLDATVTLRIRGPGVDDRQASIRIARYDLTLEPTPDRLAVCLDANSLARIEPALLSNLRLELFPLWAPASRPLTLTQSESEGVATGAWLLPQSRLDPGPWLVTAWDGDWSHARPLLMTQKGPKDPAVILDQELDALALAGKNLPGAIRIADQDLRTTALAKTVEVLRKDCLSPNWDLIAELIKAFSDLSPSALDLFPLFARDPEAVVLLLLKTAPGEVADLLAFFERLPFSWRLIPVRAWLQASRRHRESLLGQLGPLEGAQTLVSDAVDSVLAKAAEQYPYLTLIRELVDRDANGYFRPGHAQLLTMAAKADGRSILQQQLQQAMQELLRAHADDDTQGYWPQGPEILGWFKRQVRADPAFAALFLDTAPGTGYRRPVLNAPIAAALISAHSLETTPRLAFEIQTLRAFDKDWFDDAYQRALAYTLGELVELKIETLEA